LLIFWNKTLKNARGTPCTPRRPAVALRAESASPYHTISAVSEDGRKDTGHIRARTNTRPTRTSRGDISTTQGDCELAPFCLLEDDSSDLQSTRKGHASRMHSHALVCPVTHISSSEFVRQEFRSREFTDPQEHSIKPLLGLHASATAVRSSVPTLHNRLDESNRTGACIASQPRPHPRAAPFQARSSVRTLKCSRYQAQASPPPTSATHPFATAARCRTPTPVRSSTSRAAGGQSPRATRNCTVRASCCRSGPSPAGANVTGENNELAVTHTVLHAGAFDGGWGGECEPRINLGRNIEVVFT